MLKRMVDIFGAVTGLILFSPLLALSTIAIKLSSPGPVLYYGKRIGLNGRAFHMYKFCTMVQNADQIGGSSTADDDPRITRIGLMLRKWKLDELPQLINVLKGDMSLVGPRPEVKEYVDMFTKEERLILAVKPGITDYASLWNTDEGALLAGSTDPDKTYLEEIRPKKIQLQLKYVRDQSIFVDLVIIIRTVMLLLRKRT